MVEEEEEAKRAAEAEEAAKAKAEKAATVADPDDADPVSSAAGGDKEDPTTGDDGGDGKDSSTSAAQGSPTRARRRRKKPRVIPLELQRLFARLQGINQRAVSTEHLTEKGFKWKDAEGSVQHDVHELNRKVYDAVERSLVNLKDDSGETIRSDLIDRLYRIQGGYATRCMACRSSRNSDEQMFDLNLQVQNQGDLVSSLATYTTHELLTDGNEVYCENCDDKKDASRGVVVRQLPPILVFALNRFEFDYQLMDRKKVTEAFEFPLVLDMREFVAGGEFDGARAAAEGRVRAAGAVESKDEDDPAAAEAAAKLQAAKAGMVWLSQLETEEGRKIASATSASLHDVEHVYDLFCVIIHSGDAHHGHYYAYIRDTLGEGKWQVPYEVVRDGGAATPGGAAGSSKQGPPGYKAREQAAAKHSQTSPLPMLKMLLRTCPRHAQTKLHTAMLDRLGGMVKEATGSGWNAQFRDKWGALKAFLQKNDDVFILNRSLVSLKTAHEATDEADDSVAAAAALAGAQGAGATKPKSLDSMTDAELARFLQDGGDLDSLQKGAADPAPAASPDDDGWETVGAPKRKGDAGQSNKTGSGASSEVSGADDEEAKRRRREAARRADEEKLGEEWGHWFEFNDSSVSPMTVLQLRKAFEGRQCAYMLMYRDRRLHSQNPVAASAVPAEEVAPPSVTEGGVAAAVAPTLLRRSSTAALAGVDPPVYWAEQVQVENEELARARSTYERLSNQLVVAVDGPSMYTKDPQGRYLMRRELPKPAEDSGESGGAEAEGDTPPSISVTVDLRSTVGELRAQVLSQLCSRDATVPTDHKDLHLSVVRPLSVGFHVYEEVGMPKEDASGTDANKSGGAAGARGGSAAGAEASDGTDTGAALAASRDEMPLSHPDAHLSHGDILLAWDGRNLCGEPFTPGHGSETISINLTLLQRVAPQKTTKMLHLQRSTDFGMLRAIVSSKVGIPTGNLDMFILKAGRGSNVTASRVQDKYSKSGKSANLAALEIFEGTEVLVEDARAGGTSRLAYAEAKRRQHQAEVLVVDGVSPDAGAVDRPPMSFQLNKTTTMEELRKLVLRKIGIAEGAVAGGGRFRRTEGSVPTVLVDDMSESLAKAGVVDGPRLIFEAGEPLPKDHIELRYCIITGNSTLPAGGGGRRSEERTAVIPTELTLVQLKETLCEQAGLRPATDEALKRRLRTTTEFDDLGGLLKNESFTVKKAAIQNGALLCLEEGVAPIPGIVTLKFSVWCPELAEHVPVPPGIIPGFQQPPAAPQGGAADESGGVGEFVGNVLGGLAGLVTGGGAGATGDASPAADSTDGDAALAASLAEEDAEQEDGAERLSTVLLHMRTACLIELPPLKVNQETPLGELKAQLLSMAELAAARGVAEGDAERKRLRVGAIISQLEASFAADGTAEAKGAEADAVAADAADGGAPMVDGAAGDEFVPLSEMGKTPKHLRILTLSGLLPNKVLRDDSKKIQKHGMKDGTQWVVQVLEEPEELSANQLVLWLQQRSVSEKGPQLRMKPGPDMVGGAASGKKRRGRSSVDSIIAEAGAAPGVGSVASSDLVITDVATTMPHEELIKQCGRNLPFFPPRQVVWTTPPYPKTEHLQEFVEAEFGIPKARVRVAKLFQPAVTNGPDMWRVIKDRAGGAGGSGGGGKGRKGRGKKGKGRGKGKQRPFSLREHPVNLRDGDVLAVMSTDEDPEGIDNWMRIEDFVAIRNEEMRKARVRASRGGGSSSGAGGGGHKSARRAEALLLLNVDDFGDSDEGSSSDEDSAADS